MLNNNADFEKKSSTFSEYVMDTIKTVYWKAEKAGRAWKPIQDTPEALQQAIDAGAMFFTTTALSEPYDDNEPNKLIVRYGNLILDFDNKENPEKALQDMRALIDHLAEIYNLDPYSIKIFCSGSKGFHAVIPAESFGAQGGDCYLPLIYKKMVCRWKESLELQTIDISMFCMKRGKMFRIANIRRENGRYKVPLTLDEIQSMTIAELWALSDSPREVEPVDADTACEDLTGLFQEYKAEVYGEVAEQRDKAPADPEAMLRLEGVVAPCISYILASKPKTPKTTFNFLIMNVVKYFQNAGFILDDALQTVDGFLQAYPHSTEYTTYQARRKHFRAQWQYHAGNESSRFSCSYILGAGFPGSAFECSECQGATVSGGIDDEIVQDPESWPVLEPDAIYGGFIRRFIDAACKKSEADPAAILLTFLTRFSVEVGRGPFMWVGDGIQRVNLLSAIVGSTGSGRKGTSAKPVKRLFTLGGAEDSPIITAPAPSGKVSIYTRAASRPGPLSTGEGLIFAVRDDVREFVNGAWVVVEPGVDDKRLFVLSEELASAFRAMERQGNTLSTVIRSFYDSSKMEPITKSKAVTATGAHIGIVGHITNYELGLLSGKNEIHNGLINRFLWVCSRRQRVEPFPEPIPDNDLLILQAELLDILRFSSTVTEMKRSPDAAALWSAIYPELSKERGGVIGDVLARATNHVSRLAMIHALMDCSDTIEPCHINVALSIWRYCEQSARYIFELQAAGDPLQTKILEALQTGPKSSTDISNHLKRNFPAKEIQRAIKSLAELGKIERFTEKGAGRPVTKYKYFTT